MGQEIALRCVMHGFDVSLHDVSVEALEAARNRQSAVLEGFARHIGHIAIVLRKESHGYVFNAMLNALNSASLELAANGVA